MRLFECFDVGKPTSIIPTTETDSNTLWDLRMILLSIVSVTKIKIKTLFCDWDWERLLVCYYFIGYFLEDFDDVLLQVSHAWLAHTVVLHQRLYHSCLQYELRLLDSGPIHSSSQQVPLKDLLLLEVGVARQLDLLHSVQQGLRNVLLVIRWTNEQYIW